MEDDIMANISVIGTGNMGSAIASISAKGGASVQIVARDAAKAQQLAAQCLPDPIEPVYVARMALFLAADDSAMCTANNYMVEAGSI